MSSGKLLRRAVLLGAAMSLAVPFAAQARDIHMVDGQGNLLRADVRHPGVILDQTPLTGLPPGVAIAGIDVRSTTGQVVGVGSNGIVYSIDANTGATSAIGTGFSPGLEGTTFGVDVNPVPDALRVTGNTGINYRLSFATGDHGAGSPDGALNPGSPDIVASAYLNPGLSSTTPAATTLYGIDRAGNSLVTQDPPNAGTLVDPKPLGVNVGSRTGFDIAEGIGYLSTNPDDGDGTNLYRVDLGTGATTLLGPVGTGSLVIRDGLSSRTITAMTVRQPVVGPPSTNIAPAVTIVATTPAPRPNQNAAYIAQATDPDGNITRVEWDTDGDGTFDVDSGASQRIRLAEGLSTVRVRATDNRGARTTSEIRVQVRR